MENKRALQKDLSGVKPAKCFTDEEKNILQKFYNTKQKHPGPEDSKVIKKMKRKFVLGLITKDLKKENKNILNNNFPNKAFFLLK